jgi:hypothetical protein
LSDTTDRPIHEVLEVLEKNVNNPNFDPSQPASEWKKTAIKEINRNLQTKLSRRGGSYDGMLSSYDNRNGGEDVQMVESYRKLQEMNYRKDELPDTGEFKKMKSENLSKQMGFLRRLSKERN